MQTLKDKIKITSLTHLKIIIKNYSKWEDKESKELVQLCLMELKNRFTHKNFVDACVDYAVELNEEKLPYPKCELCKSQATKIYQGKQYCDGHWRRFNPLPEDKIEKHQYLAGEIHHQDLVDDLKTGLGYKLLKRLN